MIRILAAVAAGSLLASSTVLAQVRPASKGVMKALGIRSGTVQPLVVPANDRTAFSLRVILGGKVRVLEMRPHSVLSRGFALVTDNGKHLKTIPTPREVTYQGVIAGEPKSGVAGSLLDGQFTAYIVVDREAWQVQPLTDVARAAARNEHVLYRHEDILPTDAKCGHGPGHGQKPVARLKLGDIRSPAARALEECEIALDCNNHYYQLHGSNTTNVFNKATSRINQVDLIYRSQVEICYRIPTIIIRTAQVYFDGPQTGCVTGPDLLDEMVARWNSNHQNVHRDTAHMLSGWGTWSGIIGCAYIGVICNSSFGYGVSRVVNANEGSNTGLVAHELGHNWNSGHCNSSPPCYIMCSSIGSCNGSLTLFGNFAQNAILAHKASRSCLSACCPDASFTYFGSGCTGTAGVPLLSITSGPKLGASMAVQVTGAKASSLAILLHSLTPDSVDLTSIGAPGCTFYIQNTFDFSAALTNVSGVADFEPLVIPNLSALCGFSFYSQIMVIDSVNSLGLVFTRRGDPLVGN